MGASSGAVAVTCRPLLRRLIAGSAMTSPRAALHQPFCSRGADTEGPAGQCYRPDCLPRPTAGPLCSLSRGTAGKFISPGWFMGRFCGACVCLAAQRCRECIRQLRHTLVSDDVSFDITLASCTGPVRSCRAMRLSGSHALPAAGKLTRGPLTAHGRAGRSLRPRAGLVHHPRSRPSNWLEQH